MCGIAGAVGYINPLVFDAVEKMNSSQVHRGPDGEGIWSSLAQNENTGRGVILGHRRLSIIDLSNAASQPMLDQSSGSALVYNGEIYNYKSIRSGLEKSNIKFESSSDTEVLLKLLMAEGELGITRCNGMFGFAFWDATDSKLLIARDRLGIKPVYYTQVEVSPGEQTLLFASEIRALLATGLIERKISPQALDSYLWNGFVAGSQTFVEGIKLLDAGHYLTIGLNSAAVRDSEYWRLKNPSAQKTSIEEVAAEFNKAVERRLVADVPLGIFLSGGVDSSAIAAAATKISTSSIHTFNVGFPEVEFDESKFAIDVAEQIGSEHTSIQLTESDFKGSLDDALNSIDQPTLDGINTYFVSKAVREAGITVALAGTGGDELFGGYTSFSDLPYAKNIAKYASLIPTPILSPIANLATRLKTGKYGPIPPQTRWGKLADMLETKGNLINAYQVSYSIYTQDFLKTLRPEHRLPYGIDADLNDFLREAIQDLDEYQAISSLELSSFITQRLLRDTDAASMAVSLEARVPLLDHEFVQAVYGLDSHQRFFPLGKKDALKTIALSGLGKDTFERPKSGFVLPFENWLRNSLSGQVKSLFYDASLCKSVGLNPDAVVDVWRAFDSKAPGMYWSRVWVLFILLDWCKKYKMTI